MNNLGKVLITPKGDYNNIENYVKLDCVYHLGSTWLALNTVTGVEPEEGEHWTKLAHGFPDDIANQVEDVLADFGNQLTEFNSGLASKASQTALNTEKTDRIADIALANARMDTFTSLAPGSTTGDAELIDARIGADGITYPNLGSGLRTQINNINETLVNLENGYKRVKKYKCGTLADYNNGYAKGVLVLLTTNYLTNEDAIPLFLPKGARIGRARNDILDNTNKFNLYLLKRTGNLTFKIAQYFELPCSTDNDLSDFVADDDYFIGVESNTDYAVRYFNAGSSYAYGRGIRFTSTSASVGSSVTFVQANANYYAFSVNIDIDYKIEDTNRLTVGNDKIFRSPVNAVKAIHDSSKHNRYDLWIDSGTYDIMTLLGGSSFYATITEESNVLSGLLLPDYVNLHGIGECIFKGEIPTGTATILLSTKISTINTLYNNVIENIIFTAKNLRYACHDETLVELVTGREKLYKNCRFIHYGNDSGLWAYTNGYACGFHEADYFEFDGCEFSSLSFHNNSSNAIASHIDIKNCITWSGIKFGSVGSGCKHKVVLTNNNIGRLLQSISESGSTTTNCFEIVGSGNTPCEVEYLDKIPILVGDTIFKRNGTGTTIPKGTAVSLYYLAVKPCVSKELFYGIAMEDITSLAYGVIKIGGYCNKSLVGITDTITQGQKVGLSGVNVVLSNDNVIGIFDDTSNQFRILPKGIN